MIFHKQEESTPSFNNDEKNSYISKLNFEKINDSTTN